MAGIPIQIGDTVYPSQDAARKAVQAVLYGYPLSVRIPEPHGLFLFRLLQRHPSAARKIGNGIRHFEVRENTVDRHVTRGFWAFRFPQPDGGFSEDYPEIIKFSYLHCIKPRSKEDSNRKGFRHAIDDQCAAFLASGRVDSDTWICPRTSRRVVLSECPQTDHVVPFERLLQDFLKSKELTISDVTLKKCADDAIEFFLADERLEADWKQYHRERASLQILPKLDNLRKGSK